MRIVGNERIRLSKLLTQTDATRRDVAMFAVAYALVVNKAIPKVDTYVEVKKLTEYFCEIAILDRVKLELYIKNTLSYFNLESNIDNSVLQGDTIEDMLYVNKYIGKELIAAANNNINLFLDIVSIIPRAIASDKQ